MSDEGERRTIRDAMQRLIDGTPLHSDGKLTVKSLAAEAQVKRWVLTHKHTDLQDEFRARVAAHGQTPVTVQPIIAERDSLRELSQRQAEELRQARDTIHRLERVVQVLTLENTELRDNAGGKVTPIRTRRRRDSAGGR